MKKLLFLLVLLFLPLLASADAVEVDGHYYNLNKELKEAEVAHRRMGIYSGDISIPASIEYGGVNYSVTSIETGAFEKCNLITAIELPYTITSIGYDAFANCSKLESIKIPDGVKEIKGGMFWKCSSLKSVIIGSNTVSIGLMAFGYCTSLITLTIPNGVKKIEAAAFGECSSLQEINLPESLTKIESNLFYNCKSLKNIQIPNSIDSIGMDAFSGCSNLPSIIIPNSVKSIDDKAFYGCSRLSSVTIGNQVSVIGSSAFWGCTELTDVYCYAEAVPQTESNAFEGTYIESNTLYVPRKSIDNYKSELPWRRFRNILAIKEVHSDTQYGEACAKPSIIYQEGRLMFKCDTEGVQFNSEIVDSDIKQYYDSVIDLTATYNISVYATKDGLDNSEIAYATLCWIDMDPKTEGITNDVANVRAKAVLIQSNGNMLSISGLDEGTLITIYDTTGKMMGSVKAGFVNTSIPTSLNSGDICLVKIGEKTIKVLLK